MIDLKNKSYISVPKRTGKFMDDVCHLLTSNDKTKTKEHVLAVAEQAQCLAQRFQVQEDICIQSALLHDISAILKPSDMVEIAISNHYHLDEAEKRYPFLLHQVISSWIAQSYFYIDCPYILDAIACHTTLKPFPNNYDMILFLADKMAWDQEGIPPYLELIIQALDISLEDACYQYIYYLFDNHLLLYPHHLIQEAYCYLKEKYEND